MKKLTLLLLALFLVLIVAACGTTEQEEEVTQGDNEQEEVTENLSIKTTIYPLAYFASEIGGEYADVEAIIPPGSDAHTFEPTSRQMIEIAESDLFIFNEATSESYAITIIEALSGESVESLEATDGVELIRYLHDHSHEDDDHGHDDDDDHDHGHEDDDHGHGDDDDHGHGHEGDDHGHGDDDDHDHGHEDDDHGHGDDDDHDHGHEDDDHGHGDDDDHDHGHEDDDHGHGDDDDHDHGHEDDDHGHGDDDDHSHGDYDAHFWLSPSLSIEVSETILNKLIEMRPEHEEDFRSNYDNLVSRLNELDEAYEEQLAVFEDKAILVTHAAYNYWERDYGVEQIAVTGLSPSNEPSQRQLIDIIDLVSDRDINYILFEQNISSQVSEVIRVEAGLDVRQLHNLESLTEEDMSNNEDYFSIMYQNLEVLEEVLN